MNIFFTCKNTLVILLQIYRLYVVYSEHRKSKKKDNFELTNISIISKSELFDDRRKRRTGRKNGSKENRSYNDSDSFSSDDINFVNDYRSKTKWVIQNIKYINYVLPFQEDEEQQERYRLFNCQFPQQHQKHEQKKPNKKIKPRKFEKSRKLQRPFGREKIIEEKTETNG